MADIRIGWVNEGLGLQIIPGDGAKPTVLIFDGERAHVRYLMARSLAGQNYDAKAKTWLNRLDEALEAPWALQGKRVLQLLESTNLTMTVDQESLSRRVDEAAAARALFSRWFEHENGDWEYRPSTIPLEKQQSVSDAIWMKGWRRYGGIDKSKTDPDGNGGNTLFSFAWDSVAECGTKQDNLLAWDGGTSKSRASLALADYYLSQGADRIIIVGLLKHVRDTWTEDQLPKLELFNERWGKHYWEQWIDKSDKPSFTKPVICVSLDFMKRMSAAQKEFLKKAARNAVIILDEVYVIANTETAQTKATFELLEGKHHIGLSGTPFRGHPSTAWAILNWIFRSGSVAFPNYSMLRQGGRQRFNDDFSTFAVADDQTRKRVPVLKNADKFYQMCLPLLSVRRRSEPELQAILGTASVGVRHHALDFDTEHKALYESLLEQFADWYEAMLLARGEPTKILENEILVKLGVLIRATSQPWKLRPDELEEATGMDVGIQWDFPIYPRKATNLQQWVIDQAVQDVRDGRQAIIGARHVAPLELCHELLGAHGIRVGLFTGSTKNRIDLLRKFENKELDIMCCTFGVAAESLNQLGGATRAYVLEPDWVPSTVKQFEWRTVRGLVAESPISTRLTISGSVFEYMYDWGDLKDGAVAAGIHGKKQNVTGDDILDLQQYAYSIAVTNNPKLVQGRKYTLQED